MSFILLLLRLNLLFFDDSQLLLKLKDECLLVLKLVGNEGILLLLLLNLAKA